MLLTNLTHARHGSTDCKQCCKLGFLQWSHRCGEAGFGNRTEQSIFQRCGEIHSVWNDCIQFSTTWTNKKILLACLEITQCNNKSLFLIKLPKILCSLTKLCGISLAPQSCRISCQMAPWCTTWVRLEMCITTRITLNHLKAESYAEHYDTS